MLGSWHVHELSFHLECGDLQISRTHLMARLVRSGLSMSEITSLYIWRYEARTRYLL